jgi:hypothetical protein
VTRTLDGIFILGGRNMDHTLCLFFEVSDVFNDKSLYFRKENSETRFPSLKKTCINCVKFSLTPKLVMKTLVAG